MKRLFPFLVVLIFFNTAVLAEGKYLNWFDITTKTRKRIDLGGGKLQAEYLPGQWQNIKTVQIDSISVSHLPPRISTHFFNLNSGKLRVAVAGTGLMYDFDENNGILSRIDRTFYAGYNFGAAVFLRQDTLYSFGGTGFWNFSKALTYFDESAGEWENIKAQNLGPQAIFNGFHGYDKQSDLFFSGGSEFQFFLKDEPTKRDKQCYAFNFKTHTWTLLGDILPELLQAEAIEILWTGKYFIQFSGDIIYIIDPVNNQVSRYQSVTQRYQPAPLMYAHDGLVYLYWDQEGGKRITFSVSELMKHSQLIGNFYSPSSNLIYYIGGGVALILLMIVLNFFKKSRRKNYIDLDAQELSLLKALLSADSTGLSTVEVNDLLGLSNKTLDNQRRLRLNIISNINHKLFLKYRVEFAVIRKPSALDKRQSLYSLNPEIAQYLKPIV